MMLKGLFKKKISEDKLTNALLNALVQTIEKGFEDVAALINSDSDFVKNPEIKKENYDKFLFILFVGNLIIMKKRLDAEEATSIEKLLIEKFALTFNLTKPQTENYIKEYSDFMNRINYPSKNTLYAISKSIFYKYNLSQFQNDYFKDMNTPNPMFLQRLNDLVANFIWNWDYFLEKYRVD